MAEGDGNQTDYSGVTYDSVVENCLSDDVRSTIPESWKKFSGKSMNDVFQSHVNAEQEMSRRVRIPDDETSDEDRRTFHTACGCPETGDGYEFELPKGHDEDLVKWARETFHKHGISKAKAAKLYTDYMTMSGERVAAHTQAQEAKKTLDAAAAKKTKSEAIKNTRAELTKDWGGADGYKANLTSARTAFEGIYSDETRKLLKEAGLADHPAIIKDMHAHSVRMGEGAFQKGSGGKTESSDQMLNRLYPDDPKPKG